MTMPDTNTEPVAPLGPVDYGTTTVPERYRCGGCGAHGVKLWRDYNTFLNHQSLRCCDCACKEQTESHAGRGKSYTVEQNAVGRVSVTTTYDPVKEPELAKIFGGRDVGGDQIGWRIPAVPTVEGDTYWGYTSVPARGCMWWNRLPLRREASP